VVNRVKRYAHENSKPVKLCRAVRTSREKD